MKLFIVQTGQTAWQADKRIASTAGSPLTEAGGATAQAIADELTGQGVKAIYACPGEAAQQTARTIAKKLRLKVQTDESIRELDFGLWQGLSIDEIKRRQPKLYKQWTDDPSTTCPPSGETIHDAQQRLIEHIKTIAKKPKLDPAAMVLSPVSLGLLRCLLAGAPLGLLWQYVDESFTWADFQIDPQQL